MNYTSKETESLLDSMREDGEVDTSDAITEDEYLSGELIRCLSAERCITLSMMIIISFYTYCAIVFQIKTEPSMDIDNKDWLSDRSAFYVEASANWVWAATSVMKGVATLAYVPFTTMIMVWLVSLSHRLSVISTTPINKDVLHLRSSRADRVKTILRAPFISVLLSVLLSLFIVIAGAWLHFTTSITSVRVLLSIDPTLGNFGFKLPKGCVGFYENMIDPTKVRPPACYMPFYYCPNAGCGYAYEILTPDSETPTQVLSASTNETAFSFLVGNNGARSGTSFTTSTIAVSATCRAISRSCDMTQHSWGFRCSCDFNGWIGGSPRYSYGCRDNHCGCVGLYAHPDFTDPHLESRRRPLNRYGRYTNPFHAGVFFDLPTLGDPNTPLVQDPDVFEYVKTVNGITLGCEVQILDLDYSFVDGMVVNSQLSLADDDTAIMSRRWAGWQIADPQMAMSAMTAVLGSITAEDVAKKYSRSLERNFLAFAATAFEERENVVERKGMEVVAERVPKAPLFGLLGLLGLFAMMSATLAKCRPSAWLRKKDSISSLIDNKNLRPNAHVNL